MRCEHNYEYAGTTSDPKVKKAKCSKCGDVQTYRDGKLISIYKYRTTSENGVVLNTEREEIYRAQGA